MLHEFFHPAQPFAGAPFPLRHGFNRPVDVPALSHLVHVDIRCIALPFARFRPYDLRLWIRGQNQELLEVLLQSGSNDERGVLFLLEQLRRDDDVSVHRPQRNLEFPGNRLAPTAGLANRILIANHECGPNFLTEFQQTMAGEATQNKADVAFLKRFGDIRNPLYQERIVPMIGRRKWARCEKDDDRLVQTVRRFNRHI